MLRQFLEWLDSGEKTAETLLAECRRRIADRDPEIRAWVSVADRPRLNSGELTGVPFGAKDIFDTRDFPTAWGTPLCAGRQPAFDAALIRELQTSGATLIGKTQSTAFASFDPAPTRNPRLPGHTPGGSSSGSAAAVAAGMVPFAIGTQTLGSILRPASYCGVCGFKPSWGLLPFDGVMPFAPSLDTVGFFTETAADMMCLWSRGFGARTDVRLHRAAWFPVESDETMARAVRTAVERLRASGVEVIEMDPPDGWAELLDAARTINAYEGARTHQQRFRDFGDRLGTKLAALIRGGLATTAQQYSDALGHVDSMRSEISKIYWEFPAILTPAATGPAPAGYESTGDPAPNAPWTALRVPAVSLPLPVDGAPLGLQMTAAWGRDDALVSIAAVAESALRTKD